MPIQLRGGLGNAIVVGPACKAKAAKAARRKSESQIEEIRRRNEIMAELQAEAEAGAIRRHRALTPDVQKIGWRN